MLRRNIQHLILFVAVCVIGQIQLLYAQDQDSLQVVQTKWNSKTIQKGVIWHQAHFTNLFNAIQEVNWVEIDLKKLAKRVHIAGEPKLLKKTSQFAEENQALVAINAGFFDVKNGGGVDLIKVDGQVINPGVPSAARANAVFSIDGKKVRIESVSPQTTINTKAKSLMVAGPLLVSNNTRITLPNSPFNSNRHPRSAVGISGKNKLILIVVDGRSNQSYGMSLPELAKLMHWIGAKDAMNLDGGGSSTLYVEGGSSNNIVNYPSDNKKFDHEGQRSVSNIIYLKK